MHPMRGGYGMGGRGGGGGHLVAGGRGGVGMRVGGMPLPPPHMMAMAMGIAMAAAGGFAPGGMMPIPPRMPNAANMPSPGGRCVACAPHSPDCATSQHRHEQCCSCAITVQVCTACLPAYPHACQHRHHHPPQWIHPSPDSRELLPFCRAGGRQDPRGIKAYVDLDAAGSGGSGADVDYRNPTY